MCSAWWAASSGVSANLTPPAFIRPPLRTWDLITTDPPICSATRRASSLVLANPCLVTGIPALATIARDSYSKKRIGAPEGSGAWRSVTQWLRWRSFEGSRWRTKRSKPINLVMSMR